VGAWDRALVQCTIGRQAPASAATS